MKKVCLILVLCCCVIFPAISQSIHNLSFTNIDGGSVSLSTYSGRKVLIIIAPISQSDSSKLDDIKRFQLRYGDSIAIIGVMSIEDGYSSGNSSGIKALYEARAINIVLTTGMQTKKAAGAGQSALMKWLTEKNDNHRYDIDARGIGHKFFINKQGKLFGFSFPKASLQDNSVEWLIFKDQ